MPNNAQHFKGNGAFTFNSCQKRYIDEEGNTLDSNIKNGTYSSNPKSSSYTLEELNQQILNKNEDLGDPVLPQKGALIIKGDCIMYDIERITPGQAIAIAKDATLTLNDHFQFNGNLFYFKEGSSFTTDKSIKFHYCTIIADMNVTGEANEFCA